MPYTDVKTGLRAGVDKNGLPVGFLWEVMRTFTGDHGEPLGEARMTVPLTKEELDQHIGAGLTSRDADIEEDKRVRTQERAAHAAAIEAKNAELTEKQAEIAAKEAELARVNEIIAEAMKE